MSATLNGNRATSATLQLPAHGIGWAEVGLDSEVTLSGSVTLTIADLSFVGTIMSGGPSKGRSRYRIAGGAGGWGRALAGKGYANDAGVKVSTVLKEAATLAGETLDASTLPSSSTGPAFVRQAGPASRVLHELAPRNWYVGEDGITRIGRRASAAISVVYAADSIDLADGRVVIAATSIATIVPGVIVEGLEAVDVLHSIDADNGLRSTIWGAGITSASRRLEHWRRLDEALDPRRNFRGVTEYRVVTLDGDRLDLQPVLTSLGMPDLRRVVARPGVPGCKGEAALGSRVGVAFMNSDPARPYVTNWDDADSDGFVPTRLDLVGEDDTVAAAGAVGRALRYGDTVMMPVGIAGTPTPTVLVGNPLAPNSVSRVRV